MSKHWSIHRRSSFSVRFPYRRWPFDFDGVLSLARRVLLRTAVPRNGSVRYTADNRWTVSEQHRHCSKLPRSFHHRWDSWGSARLNQCRANPDQRCWWTTIERNDSIKLSDNERKGCEWDRSVTLTWMLPVFRKLLSRVVRFTGDSTQVLANWWILSNSSKVLLIWRKKEWER